MSLVFVISCWVTLGISAIYWWRFDTVTMWICRPHYWWETQDVACYMTLCLLVLSLCATVCAVKQLVGRRLGYADTRMGFFKTARFKIKGN